MTTTTPEILANKKRDLTRKIERIEEQPDQRFKELLKLFVRKLELDPSQYGIFRVDKYLGDIFELSKQIPFPIHEAFSSKEKAEEIIIIINKQGWSPWTKRDRKIALKKFGELCLGGVPESLEWINFNLPKDYNPTPEAETLFSYDDAVKMAHNCHNPRDQAVIMCAFDIGPRPFSFEGLNVGDITVERIDGKPPRVSAFIRFDKVNARRTVPVTIGAPWLLRYLKTHPGRHDPRAPLWYKMTDQSRLNGDAIRKLIRSAAERVDIDRTVKPCHLRNLRKSAASFKASGGMSQSHLESIFGWTRGSRSAAHYITHFGPQDLENSILSGMGLEPREETAQAPPIRECARCGHFTPVHNLYLSCINCGLVADEMGLLLHGEKLAKAESKLIHMAAEDPSLLEMSELYKLISEDPALFARLKEESRIKHLSPSSSALVPSN
jgi:hypothetical protein